MTVLILNQAKPDALNEERREGGGGALSRAPLLFLHANLWLFLGPTGTGHGWTASDNCFYFITLPSGIF